MSIPDSPQTREEMYLNAIASSGAIPASPQTRQEMYLNAIAIGDASGIPDSPQTREEMYLDEIARNGGGGGGGNLIASWDFKSATPTVDTVRGLTAGATNITYGSNGAIYGSSAYLMLQSLACGITIEVDVAEMELKSGTERRFINSGSNGNGFDYRSTGVWAFYASSSSGWEDSEITDGSYFSGHTAKVRIDETGIWHIYRDNDLVLTSQNPLLLTTRTFGGAAQTAIMLGGSSNSIGGAVISAVRVY